MSAEDFLLQQIQRYGQDLIGVIKQTNNRSYCDTALERLHQLTQSLEKLKDEFNTSDLPGSPSQLKGPPKSPRAVKSPRLPPNPSSEPTDDPAAQSKQKAAAKPAATTWVDVATKGAHRKSFTPPSRIAAKLTAAPDSQRKSPQEIQKQSEATAQQKRESLATTKVTKARQSVEKAKEVAERKTTEQTQKRMATQNMIEERQEKADQLHEAYVQAVKSKAENEIAKVKEFTWIQTQLTEHKKFELQQKLDDAETRRLGIEDEKKKKHAELAHPKARIKKFKKICKFCDVEIRDSESRRTHMVTTKHITKLKEHGLEEVCEDDWLVKVPLFPVVRQSPQLSEEEVARQTAREDACKKRAKKIKQKLAKLARDAETTKIAQPNGTIAAKCGGGDAKATGGLARSANSLHPQHQKVARVIIEIKDHCTKQHFAFLESSIKKLGQLLAQKTTTKFNAAVESFISTNGMQSLANVMNNYSTNNLLHRSVDAIIDVIYTASKSDAFLVHLVKANHLVSIVNVLLRGERDHDYLLHGIRVVSATLSATKQLASSDEQLWTLVVNNVGYIVNSMLFERLRSVASAKKDGFVSTNIKDYNLFIETVRILSCATSFVRDAFDTVSTNWPDRHAEITQLVTELSTELIATDFVDVVSHLASFLLQDGPPHRSKKQLSRDAHFLSVGVVDILNTCARLNSKALQTFFGSSVNQVEFYHVANCILSQCHRPDDEDSDSSEDSNTIDETRTDLLDRLIELIGLYCIDNAENQQTLLWGHPPTLLQRLLNLPFSYFSMKRQRNILFPTLLAATFKNKRNLEIMIQEVSPELLVEYLKELYSLSNNSALDRDVLQASKRFPKANWTEALGFYSDSMQSPPPIKAQ